MVEGSWETGWNADIYLSKMALTPARALRFDFVSLSGAIFSVFRSSYTHSLPWLTSCASRILPLQLKASHQIMQEKNFAGDGADVSS